MADFAAALDREILRRFDAFLTGVLVYRRHPYRRDLPHPPILWEEGSSRILNYGLRAASDPHRSRPVVLVVPSLINRAYILDLMAGRSFMRWLDEAGFSPLLLDWGVPKEEERAFSLEDYIAGRLGRALEALQSLRPGPVFVIGYCMGGLLALPQALLRQEQIAGLICLATPWDFHAEDDTPALTSIVAMAREAEPWLAGLGGLPVDCLQIYFALLDPLQILRKFQSFGRLAGDSDKARLFVALEDWLNDGVTLPAEVARQCLHGWYGENQPATGRWEVAGRLITPRDYRRPSLVVIPKADRIVPPKSAAALADQLPGSERWTPEAGHIGMMVGGRAEGALWQPLAQWIHTKARTPG